MLFRSGRKRIRRGSLVVRDAFIGAALLFRNLSAGHFPGCDLPIRIRPDEEPFYLFSRITYRALCAFASVYHCLAGGCRFVCSLAGSVQFVRTDRIDAFRSVLSMGKQCSRIL